VGLDGERADGEVRANRIRGECERKPRGGTLCGIHHHANSLVVGVENQSHSPHAHKFPGSVGRVPVTTGWGFHVRGGGNPCCYQRLIKTKTAVACVKRGPSVDEISRNVRSKNKKSLFYVQRVSMWFQEIRFMWNSKGI
jgi:hypothetical protein